jgi:hypothetical protein
MYLGVKAELLQPDTQVWRVHGDKLCHRCRRRFDGGGDVRRAHDRIHAYLAKARKIEEKDQGVTPGRVGVRAVVFRIGAKIELSCV